MKIQRTKGFTFAIENKPGKLGELTRAVSAAQVNVTGIDVLPNGGPTSTVRMLVSDPAKMEALLHQKGIQFQLYDALAVRLPNQPGSLAEVSERLGKAGVDIVTLHGYAGHVPAGQESDVVVEVSDVAQAEKVLNQ